MNLLKKSFLVLSFSLLVFIIGCGAPSQLDTSESGYVPLKHARLRWGAFFGSPFGMKFSDPQHMGTHRSSKGPKEVNGMLYTCKGGFIDVGHVREAADRTAFIKEVVFKNLMEKNTNFSFHVIEPSRYMLTITYPQNWDFYSQAEQENIANEISIDIGQYLGHTSLIWHEIITWYGFATVAPFPDKISAFSWEDPYSDVMGTYLGAAALRDMGQKYDNAMTKLLYEELKELDVQPPDVARKAAHEINGQWYSGGFYFFVNMKLRNFDVGYDNGVVAPIRVPGVCPDCTPKLYPAPNLDSLWRYGFGIVVEIEPKITQKQKIYHAINLDDDRFIEPKIHFARLIEQIRNDKKVLTREDKNRGKINARQFKQR
ncbi:MAG: DUF4056 domain-containing protein [Phycisphaerales bacterium]